MRVRRMRRTLICMLGTMLGLCFALKVILHAQVFTVKHSIGAQVGPLAHDEQARVASQHKIELDMTVTVDKIIDVGMRLQVLLGISNERLVVLAHIAGRTFTLMLEAAVLGPIETQLDTPARMYTSKQALQQRTMEHGTKHQELLVLVAKTIAMGKVKELAKEFTWEKLRKTDIYLDITQIL